MRPLRTFSKTPGELRVEAAWARTYPSEWEGLSDGECCFEAGYSAAVEDCAKELARLKATVARMASEALED